MKYSKTILFFTLSIILVSHIIAQNESGAPWLIKGFGDSYHAFRTQNPRDYMSSRTRVRGEVQHSFTNSTLFLSFNATYNALLKGKTKFDIREAYLDHQEKHWGLRLGRQLVIWGTADGVRITDLVSPMDMTEFLAQDYDDIRLPVNALRFFLFNETIKMEFLFVPTFHGYLLPTENANPWSILPKDAPYPLTWSQNNREPDFKLAHSEYGGRLNFTLPGVDFALAGLYTWNKMPVITYQPSVSGVVISPNYYRMGFLGGDISKPIGQVVFRGEAAYNIDKHFSYKPKATMVAQRGFNTINMLIGMDWYAAHEWTLMLQLSTEYIFHYQTYIEQPKYNSLLTLHISKKICNNMLQISNFTYYDVNYGGWFSRFSADYALNDQIRLSGGYDWFHGNKGVFGRYKDNSEIWMKAKYSF